MTGEITAPEAMLPGDPTTLGPYELLGRLGQGGMGTVYLARSPMGSLVAVKMVRADLASDEQFRRRFRSEVDRARQVPPFCTAEVLDADPDHEHPYLVVEYVDGPTLEDVVRQRGPLTAANLHGVAIGVATALTAIHGAGVVHRDLKPRNVLLALGSPKVIDFGIARALDTTTSHTGTGQLMGTVAYMAPERFGPAAGATLTAAADIFAWGAVVAYAGTGRTPFGSDSLPATAGRILTQQPDLDGLAGPLRSLIAQALSKEPTDRPSARELLDLLLSTGPQRSPAAAAALAHQPDLRAAAQEARAHTENVAEPAPGTAAQATAAQATAVRQVRIPTQPTTGPDEWTDVVPSVADSASPTVAPVASLPVPDTVLSPAVGGSPSVPDSTAEQTSISAPVPDGAKAADLPARRWWRPIMVAAAVVALFGVVTFVQLNRSIHPDAAGPAGPTGSTSPSAAPEASDTPVTAVSLFADPLTSRRLWNPSDNQTEHAGCRFAGALIVRRQTPGSFRCQGPLDLQPPDERVEVGVRLRARGSCASIWFRFRNNHGYQVRVCETAVYVGAHKSIVPEVYKTFPLIDHPVAVGAPSTRIRVSALGNEVEVSRDGELIGRVPLTDPDIAGGRMILGIFTEPAGPGLDGPFEVAFDNVKVFALRP